MDKVEQGEGGLLLGDLEDLQIQESQRKMQQEPARLIKKREKQNKKLEKQKQQCDCDKNNQHNQQEESKCKSKNSCKQQHQELEDKEDEGDNLEVHMPNNNIENYIPGVQKIYVKTFGCAHNVSDSEFMMGLIHEYGYQIVDTLEVSDLVLINSCTVKNPSQEAFISIVQQAKQIKKPIVVAGCVPQGDRNIQELEDVSAVGVTQIDRIVEVIEETLKGNKIWLLNKKELPSLDLPKIRKNKLIEIIPINTGCLGACTYCKTKHARGKLGSYSIEAIINRVKSVVKEGVKEIWITSEDTGAYGRDIGTDISQLLRQIVENLTEDVMIRIGMTNPPYILEHLENISMILNHPRVYSFLHIPVQSGNNEVLDRMNREYTREEFEQVCEQILKNCPQVTLATDVICGFPGETEEQFQDTLKLVDKFKFPILNISQFYARPGTAAMKMKKCGTKEKKARSQAITKLFDTFDRYSKLVGTIQRVWINDKDEKKGQINLVGHTKSYVKVLLPYDEKFLGKCVILKVTQAKTWHLEGEIIEVDPKPQVADSSFFANYKVEKSMVIEKKVKKIIEEQIKEEQEEDEKLKERFQTRQQIEKSKADQIDNQGQIKQNVAQQQYQGQLKLENNNNNHKLNSTLMKQSFLKKENMLILIGVLFILLGYFWNRFLKN